MSADTTSNGAAMVDGKDSTRIGNERSVSGIREKVMMIDSTNMATLARDDHEPVTGEKERAINGTTSSEGSQSKLSSSRGPSATTREESTTERMDVAAAEPKVAQTRRASTTSRFKEKRPEPLKLSSNMNQDIPIDLSVKSAGNIPSGALGNIFNLDLINPMAPLETPRIQWQDTDSLLASTKSRLFSSSTNASHRARVSSVMGESPPITPSTPLMDVMYSSSAAASIHRPPSDPSYSAILALESPLHSFLTSPFDLDKLHFLDKLSQPSKQDYQYTTWVDVLKGVPRRSCSSENLQQFANGTSHIVTDDAASNRLRTRHELGQVSANLGVNQKKNSISPLATRSFSNTNSEFSSPIKFSYTNQQSATTNLGESHPSATSNSDGKSLTPTSAATVNLFNIHLNSPNGSSRQSPVDPNQSNSKFHGQSKSKSPNFQALDQETCMLDMPTPMLYSHQHQQRQLNSSRGPSSGLSSSSNEVDQNNNQPAASEHYYRQQSNPSISSTATLNTPTLISPGQIIANQLGLLPSPTLSPMSSVFDIPSPFLMFSSSTAQANIQHQALTSMSAEGGKSIGHSKQACQSQKIDAYKRIKSDSKQNDKSSAQANQPCIEKTNSSRDSHTSTNCPTTVLDEVMRNTPRTDGVHPVEHDPIKNDLSHLITPAEEKTATCSKSKVESPNHNDDLDQDVDMAIEDDSRQNASSVNIPAKESTFEDQTRPSTVIPHICVSYHAHAKSLSNLQEDPPKPDKISHQPSMMSGSNCLGSLESNQDGTKNHDGRRWQRNSMCKRSLSPRTFHARVKNYHIERLESSSAPPDVHQRQRRSKIKTATASNADSCFELTHNNDSVDKVTKPVAGQSDDDKSLVFSQSASCLRQAQSIRNSSRPYPEVQAKSTTLNYQFASQANLSSENSFWNGRSSSAGPDIYASHHGQRKTAPCPISNGCPENLMTLPAQSASNLYAGQANQNYTQQRQQLPSQPLTRDHQSEQQSSHRFQTTNPLQQQLHYHSLTNHHFQNNTHANHYDHDHQQRSYNAHQLHSMSACELQRLQYSRSGGQTTQPPQLPISNNGTHSRVNAVELPLGILGYNQSNQQIQTHHQSQQQQQSFHHEGPQIMAASNTPISSWSAASHRMACSDSQFSNQNANLTQTNALINQIGRQPATAQMLGRKFEATNAPNPYEPMGHVSVQANTSQSKGQESVLTCANSILPQELDQPASHIIDIETRSESRSNSSLDFASSFAGSRSNSAASTNLSAKKYHCDQCSKSFTRSDMLTRHRRLHSGDRPFQCTECKQEFSRSDHLSTHMRTHTGEKPYKCKLCTYSACRKDMITRHLKVHNRSPNLAE